MTFPKPNKIAEKYVVGMEHLKQISQNKKPANESALDQVQRQKKSI